MIKHFLKSLFYSIHPKKSLIHLEYDINVKPRYTFDNPHPRLLKIISSGDENYKNLISKYKNYTEDFDSLSKSMETSMLPNWNNGFLPPLDIISLYTMLVSYKPQKYIEVGSGNSTKIARWTIDKNKLKTKIICIDPTPRTDISLIADEIIKKPLEQINLDQLKGLKANDVLFIDNSHRMLPNSDVTSLFLDLFHELASGVIVQIHDIYLPYDYPQFMCNRFYSEQYGLAILIMANPDRYRVLCPNYYISNDPDLKKYLQPIWNITGLTNREKHGGSFWLEIQ